MSGETVNEDADPVSRKTYWGNSRVFNAYNTDYLAQGIPKSQEVYFEAYDLTLKERLMALWQSLRRKEVDAVAEVVASDEELPF